MSNLKLTRYSVVGLAPGKVFWRGLSIDLRTITDEQADELYNSGFQYLKKKRTTKKES
jgi:hypothetical protein